MKLLTQWHIPIRAVSESNISEHWTSKSKRHKTQKYWIYFKYNQRKEKIPLPCLVKLTRIGKRMLDSDNLAVSMKWIRDAIADILIPGKPPGHADNDPRISWEYSQQIGKEYAVIIEFYNPENQF
jgi:hypothetical protein